jgi:hypothetical protein
VQEAKNQYRNLMFGDFVDKVDEFSNLNWAFFVGFTFFITVILMNLLIAIITDTYSKVMRDVKRN